MPINYLDSAYFEEGVASTGGRMSKVFLLKYLSRDGGHYDGEEGWFGDSNLLSP